MCYGSIKIYEPFTGQSSPDQVLGRGLCPLPTLSPERICLSDLWSSRAANPQGAYFCSVEVGRSSLPNYNSAAQKYSSRRTCRRCGLESGGGIPLITPSGRRLLCYHIQGTECSYVAFFQSKRNKRVRADKKEMGRRTFWGFFCLTIPPTYGRIGPLSAYAADWMERCRFAGKERKR